MRCLLLILALVPLPAAAEISSPDECRAAVAADPDQAREDAAIWFRSGGGVAARLCEADALSALGAHGTAATLLTRVAENPNRAMGADLRAVVFGDAAAEWLADDRPDLALATLDQADQVAPVNAGRLVLRARADAANGDWEAARAALGQATTMAPEDAEARALLAATLRNLGDPKAALAEAEAARNLDPDQPEVLFETAAALAETGDIPGASALWQRLIALHPDSPLVPSARANIQRLN